MNSLKRLLAVGLTAGLSVLVAASPASAAGGLIIVNEATGVGGPQPAGTVLRVSPTSGLVASPTTYSPPTATPPSGLRVRTNNCTAPGDVRFLEISEIRMPPLGSGSQDVVVSYPASCTYTGLVNITLIPASGFPGGTRSQPLVITP
jgi:hypothetical protein